MTDLDHLASDYLRILRVSPGPGVDAIQTRGRRRRRRLLAAKVTGGAVIVFAVVAAALVFTRDEPTAISAVDESSAEQQTTREPLVVDLEDQLLGLDDWNESQLPTVPTPAVPGWTTVVRTVNVTDRFADHALGFSTTSEQTANSLS